MKKEKMAKKFEEYGKKLQYPDSIIKCIRSYRRFDMMKFNNIMFNFVLILIFSTIVFSLKAEAKKTPSFKSKTYTAYTNEKIRIKIKNTSKKSKTKWRVDKKLNVIKKNGNSIIVSAASAGEFKITAKIGKKKIKCIVKIKEKASDDDNTNITDSQTINFDSQQINFEFGGIYKKDNNTYVDINIINNSDSALIMGHDARLFKYNGNEKEQIETGVATKASVIAYPPKSTYKYTVNIGSNNYEPGNYSIVFPSTNFLPPNEEKKYIFNDYEVKFTIN